MLLPGLSPSFTPNKTFNFQVVDFFFSQHPFYYLTVQSQGCIISELTVGSTMFTEHTSHSLHSKDEGL